MIWQVVTHALVGVGVFIASQYFFTFLAIGAAINKCGTETEYTIAQSRTGERVRALDTVCDWTSPGHNVQVYRVSAGRTEPEVIAKYSTSIFLVPHAAWDFRGRLVIELPHVKHLSTGPYADSNVTIKLGSVL